MFGGAIEREIYVFFGLFVFQRVNVVSVLLFVDVLHVCGESTYNFPNPHILRNQRNDSTTLAVLGGVGLFGGVLSTLWDFCTVLSLAASLSALLKRWSCVLSNFLVVRLTLASFRSEYGYAVVVGVIDSSATIQRNTPACCIG